MTKQDVVPEVDRQIEVQRTIDAPTAVVFEAFTAVEHLSRWWGPDGFTTTTRSFEFRPGGVWEFVMHGPDGSEYPNRIEWHEIEPGERIVYSHGSSADDPDAFESTVTFRERQGGTEVTLRAVFKTKEQRDVVVQRYRAEEGAHETLARLASHLDEGSGGAP